MTYEAPLILGPDPSEVTASVIWLHGLGADGNDFAPIVPHLSSVQAYTRFIFPHAPMIPVTINQGFVMRAWYDIKLEGSEFVSDNAGIEASSQMLRDWLEAEHEQGIPYHRIVLAGFSQGGAIAQHTALRFRESLAGVMALSTYLPLAERTEAERSAANCAIPYLMAHGRFDRMLPIARAEGSKAVLESLGYRIKWQAYDMEHAVCSEEIADIDRWLGAVLPPA